MNIAFILLILLLLNATNTKGKNMLRNIFIVIFIVFILGYFIMNGLDDIEHVIFKMMD